MEMEGSIMESIEGDEYVEGDQYGEDDTDEEVEEGITPTTELIDIDSVTERMEGLSVKDSTPTL